MSKKTKNRKEKFLLISNGGFLDSLEEGWEAVKKTVKDFDAKDTINQIFGDSSSKKELGKKLTDLEKKNPEAAESEIERMAKDFAKELKDFFQFKSDEEAKDKSEDSKKSSFNAPLEGYRRADDPLPSNAHEEAKKLLPLPMGSMKSIKLNDGKWYIAVVEEHFDNHPRGGGEAYKHKGVSLFEPIAGNGEYRELS